MGALCHSPSSPTRHHITIIGDDSAAVAPRSAEAGRNPVPIQYFRATKKKMEASSLAQWLRAMLALGAPGSKNPHPVLPGDGGGRILFADHSFFVPIARQFNRAAEWMHQQHLIYPNHVIHRSSHGRRRERIAVESLERSAETRGHPRRNTQ